MSDLFLRLANNFSAVYFIRQLLVILFVYALGLLVMTLVNARSSEKEYIIYNAISAFPVGLSLFIILAYIILTFGIVYCTVSVVCALALIFAYVIYAGLKNGQLKLTFSRDNRKLWILILLSVIAIAAIACMGLAPVSISNDSMYYFHEYPRDIVYFGHLRDQFDSFLTDTGLGSVAIETLPFLFGFNESFGIREFTHICFTAFIMFKVYQRSRKWYVGVLAGAVTAFSSPVYILGHWAMANMYFMEFFFMAAVFMMDAGESIKETGKEYSAVMPGIIVSVACALLRMEGGIFILLLLGCYTLINIKEKHLIIGIAMPILVLLGIYEIRIYTFYKIDNPYTFLTPQKAVLQAIAFLGIIVYMALIKKRLPGMILDKMPHIIVLALLGANALLFVYNRELYMANIKAFYGNFMGQSGWGMLPQLIFSSIAILVVGNVSVFFSGRNSKKETDDESKHDNAKSGVTAETYFTTLTAGFVLVTIAVSFMRGDALNVNVGDSGNRVMMQVTPLVIYTFVLFFVRLYEQFRIKDN